MIRGDLKSLIFTDPQSFEIVRRSLTHIAAKSKVLRPTTGV
jgi:hypothetical protein